MQSKFIQYQNKNIHYRVAGSGNPVVLLHGLPLEGNVWNNIAEELNKNFLLIIPDLPGSGKSEMMVGENISIENYAETVKAILEEEGVFLCIMIGHSMGGYITLAFAEKYPELLSALGLFHSSAFADTEQKKQTRLKAIEFIKSNGAFAFLKTLIPGLFADKNHPYIKKLVEISKNCSADTLIQYYHAMINRPDRTQVLKISKPVLFIIGERDTTIPLETSLQQCHLPSISYVNILQNVAHMGMVEDPQRCSHILLSFLENIWS